MVHDNVRYIVITSDEHAPPTMDRGAWASRPEIRGDFERGMQFVHNWCEQYWAEGILRISCADTLDSFEPEPDRLKWLADYFDKHLNYCKAYYYIQGQHDRVARCPNTPWLSVVCPSGKMIYAHKKIIEIAGRYFVFHDNASPAQLMESLHNLQTQDLIPDNTTLIAHQLWHPWLPANRVVPSLKALPTRIGRVFSGDYHIQKEERLATDAGTFLDAWSVGPMNIQDISEPNSPRFLVIDCKDWTVKSIPIPARPVHKFDIRTDEDLDAFLAFARSLPVQHDDLSIDKPIIKVRYLTSLDMASRQIRDACESRAHLFPDPAVVLQGVSLDQVYSRSNKQDVEQCLDACGKVPRGSLPRQIVDISLSAVSQGDLTAKLDELQATIIEVPDENRGAAASEVLPTHESIDQVFSRA